MQHLAHRRGRCADELGVCNPWRAEVVGDGKSEAGAETVVEGLDDEAGLSTDPSATEAEGIAFVEGEVSNVLLDAVCFVVAMPVGD